MLHPPNLGAHPDKGLESFHLAPGVSCKLASNSTSKEIPVPKHVKDEDPCKHNARRIQASNPTPSFLPDHVDPGVPSLNALPGHLTNNVVGSPAVSS